MSGEVGAISPAVKELAVTYRRVADLVPYARNARTHSDAQVAQIVSSIREFGWTNPILVDGENGIVAGHGRLRAAQALGMASVPTIELSGLTEPQRRAYVLADNRLALNAGWDDGLLAAELAALQGEGFDAGLLGFSADEVAALAGAGTRGKTDANAIPAAPEQPVSRHGDVWLCGRHRVMCGDSTDRGDVKRLCVEGTVAALLHADPPYGMGKESEGVENDNLYRQKLDRFQVEWLRAWRPFLADNGSVYIWGQAPDLWRLWYSEIERSERVTFRNEIVWDKETGMGMSSDTHRQFATVTERCLFYMLGQRDFGNVNKDDYWEGFEPIRSYLEAEAVAADLNNKRVHEICGVQMYGHWFSKSQWCMIPEKHYAALREATERFRRPYHELRALYDGKLGDATRLSAKHDFYALRAFFDNTHDNMADVWRFPRVVGDERHGHATPKPVEMIARALRSSCPVGGVVLEPFAGSGSTMIAAETAGRSCYTMELTPAYVDVAVKRWQDFTGLSAVHEEGHEFNGAG